MVKIVYIDIEFNPATQVIERSGLYCEKDQCEPTSILELKDACQSLKPAYICGHNFIDHDKKHLSRTSFNSELDKVKIIDTLYLSMLLFVNKKIHKLDKPYKTDINIENKPLGDAKATAALFDYFLKVFSALAPQIKSIYFQLLREDSRYSGFFNYLNAGYATVDIYSEIKKYVACGRDQVEYYANKSPIELAYVIAFLIAADKAAIAPVILQRYPEIVQVLKDLSFDVDSVDILQTAKDEFNIDNFREFNVRNYDVFNTSKVSQKNIINAALESKSLLAVLPTGGGKTITFQLPAVIKAKAYKGLSIVISPLQALMRDQVDSFKNDNFKVVAISGYLNPVERLDTIRQIESGIVDIVYLAPESLRSRTIYNALKKRIIERFIIDEAHCFSTWGHDFRHDYFFIYKFIEKLQNNKFQPKIPVSCFTATAKPEVLTDIKRYFSDFLEIEMEEFIASTQRERLSYTAIKVMDNNHKYVELLKQIQRIGKAPTIIYIPQNARECKKLSQELNEDPSIQTLDLVIEPFYAKMDGDIDENERTGRNKQQVLQDFIDDKVDIVVATTAFGMGIDKPNIKAVIHYQQSDSLESYLQESGRGARGKDTEAECIALYCEEDFDRTFTQLSRSKIEYREIRNIGDALKKQFDKTKRTEIYVTPKDLARQAKIDTEDSSIDYELRVKTALLELEKAGVIERSFNQNTIYATSIESNNKNKAIMNMEYVHEQLKSRKQKEKKCVNEEKLYDIMILVMQNIIQRSKNDIVEAEYLSDIVGVRKNKIFKVLNALKEVGLIAKNNDISIYVSEKVNMEIDHHFKIETNIFKFLRELPDYQSSFSLRDLQDYINPDGKNDTDNYKLILRSWSQLSKLSKNDFKVSFKSEYCDFRYSQKGSLKSLKNIVDIRQKIGKSVLDYVLRNISIDSNEVDISSFDMYEESKEIKKISLEGFHHTLVFLHDLLTHFKLRRGRLIYYSTYQVKPGDNINENTVYKKREYNQSLEKYYLRKIEAIHIHMELLKSLINETWDEVQMFVEDYFSINYEKFKDKYGFDKNALQRPITAEKHKQILSDLNNQQKSIFDDHENQSIMILAGPGSGKTKTLVHKIASMVTIENNKPEHFLMLAHSRVAVKEFKERLQKLIGNQVYDIKIYTFHSFAIQLLAKKINDKDTLKKVIPEAAKQLANKKASLPMLTMLVLDEYQDVDESSYHFIREIHNNMDKDKTIIAVGDDDQCINNFKNGGAKIDFIKQFKEDYKTSNSNNEDNEKEIPTKTYELLKNYRSTANIIELINSYAQRLPHRLKSNPLIANTQNQGEISLTKYLKGAEITRNLVVEVTKDESKTIAILARTNDEVLGIYSLLKEKGVIAYYITEKSQFKLGQLHELQAFVDCWQSSKDLITAEQALKNQFKGSKNLSLALNVIDTFKQDHEEAYNQLYFNQFIDYLKVIDFDEFELGYARITVSTMHKAKGKEFDSVYISIKNDFNFDDAYEQRLFYVAISRAKINLHIHSQLTIDWAHNLITRHHQYSAIDEPPNRIALSMGLEDIWLSYYATLKEKHRHWPKAGEQVNLKKNNNDGFSIRWNNREISRLSKPQQGKDKLSQKINKYLTQGYSLDEEATIEYMVQWKDSKDHDKLYIHPLCVVYMHK